MKKVFFFLCTTWVVLFNNSRMSTEVPSYDLLCVFRFPHEVRIFEVLALLAGLAACASGSASSVVRRVNVFTILFVAVALIGLVPGSHFEADRLSEIYVRIVPMLFFIVVATLGVTRSDVEKLVRFHVIVTLLSSLVALVYQIPRYGSEADYIHGFYSDAHILGTMVAILAVGCLSHFLETRRPFYLVAALALMVFSRYPGNDKVVLLSASWFMLVLVREYVLRLGWLGRMAVACVLLLLGYYAFEHFVHEPGSPLRLFELSEFRIVDLGPLAAWPIALVWLTSSPFVFLFGLGCGEYGWLAASRAVAAGGGSPASQTFEFEFSLENARSAGFLFRTNTWTSLLVEYGVIGCLLFVAAVVLIVMQTLKHPATTAFDRTMRRVFVFTLAAVVFQGFFTPFSNWSESIVLFPLMYLAAYFCTPQEN